MSARPAIDSHETSGSLMRIPESMICCINGLSTSFGFGLGVGATGDGFGFFSGDGRSLGLDGVRRRGFFWTSPRRIGFE